MVLAPDVIMAQEPKLLDRVRHAIRVRHCSRRPEDAYVAWIRRFVVFHGKRHPGELGEREVTASVTSLAVRGVSASTQNQALSAILFLFGTVLGQRLPWMNEIVRALRDHLTRVKAQHEADLAEGRGSVA